MTEAELWAEVHGLALDAGVLAYKAPDWVPTCYRCHAHLPVAPGDPGWPDVVLVGAAGKPILFRELKTESGVVSAVQRRWGAAIERTGGNWAPWRPRDLTNGVIKQQIDAITREGFRRGM